MMGLSMLGLWLTIVIALVACTTDPICDSTLFNSLTTSDYNQTGMILLYSQRLRSCNVQVFGTSYLVCGNAVNPTYTSYSVSIATSGTIAGSAGLCGRILVTQVAPVSIVCHQYYPLDTPPSQPISTLVKPVYFGIAITRTFLFYPIEAMESFTVPFSYTQYRNGIDKLCTNSATSNNTFDCAYPRISQPAFSSGQSCNQQFKATTFGDASSGTIAQCGAYSDDVGDLLTVDFSQCQYVCCASCGVNGTNSSWTRWPVGPVGQIYRFGDPQVRIYGGIVVSLNEDLQGDNDVILFQNAQIGQDGQIVYGQGLGQTRDFVSKSRKARATLNALAKASLPPDLVNIPGVMIRYMYGEQTSTKTSCDMGVGNPYATDKIKAPCLAGISSNLTDSLPLVVPAGATPDTLGIGIVPTQTGLGSLSQCSWYYVPPELTTSTIAPTGSNIIGKPVSQQVSFMWNGLFPEDGTNVCPGGNGTDLFNNYIGLPGFELNTTTGLPLQISGCQMSSINNEYATKFMNVYTVTGNITQALEQAGPTPPYLLPRWNIVTPRWYPHDNGMIFDLGAEFPQQNAGELLIQLADDKYLSAEAVESLYQITSQSMCTTKVRNGVGNIEVIVAGLLPPQSGSYGESMLIINCTANQGKTVIIYDMNTNEPLVNNQIVFDIGQGSAGIVGPLNMSFAPNANYIKSQPYVICTAQLATLEGQTYNPAVTLSCIQLGGQVNKTKVPGSDSKEDAEDQNNKLYITLGGIGAVLVLFIIAGAALAIGIALSRGGTMNDLDGKEM